jgi:hypothetical protein
MFWHINTGIVWDKFADACPFPHHKFLARCLAHAHAMEQIALETNLP